MARKANPNPPNRPTDSEMGIMNILWNRGPSTVRQVHDELSLTKPSHYTTTLKLMQILVDKSLIERTTIHGVHVYQTRIAREEAQREMAAHLMNRAFDGSVYQLLVGALGVRAASEQELD